MGARTAPAPVSRWPKAGPASGLSIIEMMMVVLVIALLLLLLIPLIEKLHGEALKTECGNKLRMIGQAIEMYQIRSDGWLPANQDNGSWRTHLDPFLNTPFEAGCWRGKSPIWNCPAEGEYFANNQIIGDNRLDPQRFITHTRISKYLRVPQTPVVSDVSPGDYARSAIGDFRGIHFRHMGGAMFLYLDWHVDWIPPTAEDVMRWWSEPTSGKPAPP